MNSLGLRPLLLASPATRTTAAGGVALFLGSVVTRRTKLTKAQIEEINEKRMRVNQMRKKGAKHTQPEGHGERIWIHNHIVANHIVWSFTPDLRPNKAMRQFPYTGKKNVPGKLRKDYWQPMALIEFPEGQGEVGRSVYQKCRELKKRHELEWEDESLLNMTRKKRGQEINDQKGNTVADLAYVLAGNGKGNKVPVTKTVQEEVPLLGQNLEAAEPKEGEEKKEIKTKVVHKVVEETTADGKKVLRGATVYWANEQDRYFAEEWTDNVTHVVGLPERVYQKRETKKEAIQRKPLLLKKVEKLAEDAAKAAEAVANKVAEDKAAA